ncbi:hypothetical protein PAAG_03695 [Paracoccidioides lutzii Pb01]|uniref:Uncharacterized protein n=1 Tax=Paracoccidioides lutzii (strain ATCC MYA-826 / Pb01) TaxID=502779 RepID=C1GYV1_PARBA|nr:hypothetical protein PAAG_03695 [Paracoccidioides lutzii Pb01]EEH41774.1 hypothetical protein PAAG_03695 [Paracoccidioides lutzii Pb01]
MGIRHVMDFEDWRNGSFNVCLWIGIVAQGGGQAKRSRFNFLFLKILMRTAAQTMRIKGAVANLGPRHKLQQNRSTVPIPQLYGLGPSMGQTVYTTLVSFKRGLLLKSLVHNFLMTFSPFIRNFR